jgi:ubiquitin C-terminal hydrolase
VYCEDHAANHFESSNKKNKRDQVDVPLDHCVFLHLDAPMLQGRCLHCSLDVASGEPTSDEWFENRGSVAVNAEGYCIDYEDYFGPAARAVLDAIAGTNECEEDGNLKKKNRKAGKKAKNDGVDRTIDRETRKREMRAAGLVGLRNLGNTCFFNATMQCILQCPEVIKMAFDLLNAQRIAGSLSRAFFTFLTSIATGDLAGSTVSPSSLFSQLCRRNCMFQEMGQQDAQELYSCLMNGIVDEFAVREGRQQRVPIGMGGTVINTFRCLQCGKERRTAEPFFELSVPVRRSIQAGVAEFLTEELLCGDNAYACENCHREAYELEQRRKRAEQEQRDERALQLLETATNDVEELGVEATNSGSSSEDEESDADGDGESVWASNAAQISATTETPATSKHDGPSDARDALRLGTANADAILHHALDHLQATVVVHVKRFQANMKTYQWEKSTASVEIGPTLELSSHLKDPGQGPAVYHLCGIVEHQGSIDSGHYVAYVRSVRTNTWFLCSDDSVAPCTPERAMYSQPYLVFYHKS